MSELPRLLYFSDVFAENSFSGALVMYRLLEAYPADRLLVLETSHQLSVPARRLHGVTYRSLPVGSNRLGFTRLHRWWQLWTTTRMSAWADLVPEAIGAFAPEAVLTVAHGHAWVAAAEYARRRNLPLHVVIHDDWPRMVSLPAAFSDRVDRQVAAIYPSATSRLCVSPWMEEEYQRRYHADGDVMYPSRSITSPPFDGPPERLAASGQGLTIALAGNIRAREYFQLLARVGRALAPAGGRVLVFGPTTAELARAEGLDEPNVSFEGLLPPAVLAGRLRADADVLLVQMAFDPAEESNMRTSFPSKLVDYTHVGVPLLISGPEYATAVQWSRRYPGVAETVTSTSDSEMAAALARLSDPQHRLRLARRSLEIGEQLFSHGAAWRVLTGVLQASTPRGVAGTATGRA